MIKRLWHSVSLYLPFLLLCFLLCQPVLAETASSRVFDEAGLFSLDEAEKIDAEIQHLREETSMDYVVLTIDNAEEKTSQEYADDYYEAGGFGTADQHSGMLYLIDMDNREIYVSAKGDMMRYLTDQRLDVLLDHAFEYVAEGYYADSALSVLKDLKDFTEMGIPDDQYNYSSESGEIDSYEQEKGFPILALILGTGAGLASALITFFSIKGKYHLTTETYHYPLSEKSELQLNISEDRLVNQFVTHRKIPKNPPSSGSGNSGSRTTTHRSSSGQTHSGGGRSF